MKNVNKKEQVLVNGGALHYHWKCTKHGMTKSVARSFSSADAWAKWHNMAYHNKAKVATIFSCRKSCGTIHHNQP